MLYLNLLCVGIAFIPICYEGLKYRNNEEFRNKLNNKYPKFAKYMSIFFLPNDENDK